MADAAQLDHVVINVRTAMDAAEPLFRALGFTLTPRGHHTLGSINHLMMFGTDYLELLGLPAEAADSRPEVARAPLGLNGLVFKSANVDDTFAAFQAQGIAGDPPKAFSRPVKLDDGARDARFRTVHVRPDVFPAGRVYYCEHGTPDLVWRPEWQRHANGARRIAEFIAVSRNAQAEAESFATMLRASAETDGKGAWRMAVRDVTLRVLSPERYADRFGDLAVAMADRGSIFGALVMQTGDLEAVKAAAAALGDAAEMRERDGALAVRLPAFDSLLVFAA